MDYKLKPSALDYFTTLVQSDDDFPLLETAISLAQDEFPALDIEQVLGRRRRVHQTIVHAHQRAPAQRA